MSGLLGILNYDGAPIEPPLLERMTDSLAHAGPDRRGTWTDGRIALGHALLRTTAESAGEEQPSSLDGQVWIAADARVDGRGELIRELRERGRGASADSPDAELILHAYHVWGEDCLAHLIGDFAFAIWDGRRERLFCARDQFGVVPLYYACVRNSLIFSNVLNCLRAHPAISDELNEQAIGDFLLFNMNMDVATTMFADIRALPPAHALTWADGELNVRRYWDLPVTYDDGRDKRPSDYVERFAAVFDRAVGDRLRSGAAAVHLSGGMDSTSIAATASKLLKARGGSFDLRAFTVVYDHLIPEEEGRYANEVAAAIDVPVEHLVAEEYMSQAPRPSPEWVFPEPVAIPNQVAEYEIMRRASTFAPILLAGFGGDPLFRTGSILEPAAGRPRWGDVARALLQSAFVDRRLPRPGLRPAIRRRLGRLPGRPADLPDWIDPDFAGRVDLAARLEDVRARRESGDVMLSPLWPNIFTWSHPGFHGLPLKTLFPFFDLRLVQCVRDAPPFTWRQGKRLLREAMRGLLPESVRQRPKTLLYASGGEPDTGHPAYKLALDPARRRWREELISVPDMARYIDADRARARIESPTPASAPRLAPCFPLAHWLRWRPHARGPTEQRQEPPHVASPTAR